MSFPFSEHPNDDDMPVSVPAPELGPNGTIEVQAIYGAGQVMLSFLSPCSSYEVSLSVETVDALLSALRSEIATAAEFADREEGVFVKTPLIECLPDVPEADDAYVESYEELLEDIEQRFLKLLAEQEPDHPWLSKLKPEQSPIAYVGQPSPGSCVQWSAEEILEASRS